MDQVTEDSLNSPLFFKYLKAFQDNPKSLVFAPLAEAYRKTGMIDKALEVLRAGLRHHGDYLMGHLVLGHCHYDQSRFDQAYNVVRPFILSNKDNFRLQKLYADICIELGKDDEALSTLKYLLFLNSKNEDIGRKVELLEKKGSLEEVILENTIYEEDDSKEEEPQLFEEKNLQTEPAEGDNFEENWTQVDFIQRPRSHFEMDDITVHKTSPFKGTNAAETIDTSENEAVSEGDELKNPESGGRSLLTHTLADLYMAQGHLDKAKEILGKVLELNPDDERTRTKLNEVEFLITQKEEITSGPSPTQKKERSVESEEDGREALMRLYDEAKPPVKEVNSTDNILAKLDYKLGLFLEAIHKKADNYKKSQQL